VTTRGAIQREKRGHPRVEAWPSPKGKQTRGRGDEVSWTCNLRKKETKREEVLGSSRKLCLVEGEALGTWAQKPLHVIITEDPWEKDRKGSSPFELNGDAGHHESGVS